MARGRPSQRGRTGASKGKIAASKTGMDGAYREMLAEVESSPAQTSDEGRAVKRRRVRGRMVTQDQDPSNAPELSTTLPKPIPQGDSDPSLSGHNKASLTLETDPEGPRLRNPSHIEQTTYNDESSEESDFAWEQVDLAQETENAYEDHAEQEEAQDLQLVLDGNGKHARNQSGAPRRKPLTAVERRLRLEVHKVHILCLLSHVHIRNYWCNDQNIHVRKPPTGHGAHQCRLRGRIENSLPSITQANRLSAEP